MAVKQPLSVAEAYMDFNPSPSFAIRGGRSEEVFADNMRFLWDDDVRFNGFHQSVTLPVSGGPSAFTGWNFAPVSTFSNPDITCCRPRRRMPQPAIRWAGRFGMRRCFIRV